MDKIQKICASAFIFKDSNVLLLKRSKSENPFPEYWELPGGKIEFGESPENALKREVMEEVGIEIEVKKPYSDFSYIYNDKHYIDIQYACNALSSNVQLSHEHEDYCWANINELDDLKISPEMKTAIKIGFENL